MNKLYLYLFLIFTSNFFYSMDKTSKEIKPDSLAQRFVKKAMEPGGDILTCSLIKYKTFKVLASDIVSIRYARVTIDKEKAQAYEATLNTGHEISGYYFKEGAYAKEIWALFWPIIGSDDSEYQDPFPIPQENFFILRETFNSRKNKKITT